MITEEGSTFRFDHEKMPITERQAETLALVMNGFTWREVAKIQGVSKNTVEKSLERSRENTDSVNNITMIVEGFCNGWIQAN